MERVAQMQLGGLASNPANGVNNIMLQNGTGAEGAGSPDQITSDTLLPLLDDISKSSMVKAMNFEPQLQQIYDKLQTPDVKRSVGIILNAMQMANDPEKQSIDPSTGEPDKTAPELAKKLADRVRKMQLDQTNTNQEVPVNNQAPAPAQAPVPATAKVSGFNYREAEGKKKKKTRGNPFRVLMGQVGKLLDHGMDKRDIVRYLDKKGMFNKETIERCVDVVRDYNKKKRREDPTDDKSEGKKEKTEKTAGIEILASKEEKPSEIIKPTRILPLEPILAPMDGTDDADNEKKVDKMNHKAGFNLNSYRTADKNAKTVYDIKPDWEKRSTTELYARAGWLKSLIEMKDAADKKGASSELKAINAALSARGFDVDELHKTV